MSEYTPPQCRRIVLLFVLCGGIWFAGCGGPEGPQRRAVTEPGADFTHYTGLAWPAAAQVVSAGDIWLDFVGDGEFHLVFDTDHATLEQWLTEAPPWEQLKWTGGPVPDEISWQAGFGVKGMNADPAGGGPDHKISEVEYQSVYESKQTWYVAQDRGAGWQHGQILILDLEKNRVWFSRWDY
ncbi:hypothetical protein Mal35_46090 [Gimesia maris]|uniref:hypothetical protein n=1 Tax=Gimesia maris TaxID=122 RepID=UPI00118BEB02|nr:hypothetical protein [Gimesia maris]QDT81131.1 hypothetical protein Mal35_46090 [Gimesia maris]